MINVDKKCVGDKCPVHHRWGKEVNTFCLVHPTQHLPYILFTITYHALVVFSLGTNQTPGLKLKLKSLAVYNVNIIE